MSYVSIDLSEVHALARDIQRNADEVPARAQEIIAVGGHAVVADAQVFAPVDTGNLKNSIGVDVDGLRFEAGPTAEYGEWVETGALPHAIPNAFGWGPEFGTEEDFHPGNDPQPFMGPAFDRHEPRVVAALASLGSQILERG